MDGQSQRDGTQQDDSFALTAQRNLQNGVVRARKPRSLASSSRTRAHAARQTARRANGGHAVDAQARKMGTFSRAVAFKDVADALQSKQRA